MAYAVFLGIMLAKAESDDKRKQAKKRITSTVAGLFIIVILTVMILQFDFSDTYDMPDQRYNPDAYVLSTSVFAPDDRKIVNLVFETHDVSSSSAGGDSNANIRLNNTSAGVSLDGKAVTTFTLANTALTNSAHLGNTEALAFAEGVSIVALSPTSFEILNASNAAYPIRVDVDTVIHVPLTAPFNAMAIYGTTDPMEIFLREPYRSNPSLYPGHLLTLERTFGTFIQAAPVPPNLIIPAPPGTIVGPGAPPGSGGGGGGGGGPVGPPPTLAPQNGVFRFWPVAGNPGKARSAGFGYISTNKRYHAGIDIGWGKASLGQSTNVWVYAAHDGIVRNISTSGARDYWYITIEHQGTFSVGGRSFSKLRTNYIHVNDIRVTKGQRVSAGQAIARVAGSNSFTPHLHFEVTNGGANNPKNSNPPANATLQQVADNQRLLHPMMLYPNHGLSWGDRVPL